MGTASVFERDVQAYRSQVPHLLPQSEGKFALIRGAEVVGVHDSQDEAMTAGYSRFGRSPFLVKVISSKELALLEQWCPA